MNFAHLSCPITSCLQPYIVTSDTAIHTAVLSTGQWFQAKTSLRENMQISKYYTEQQNCSLLAAYVWLCYCTALHPIQAATLQVCTTNSHCVRPTVILPTQQNDECNCTLHHSQSLSYPQPCWLVRSGRGGKHVSLKGSQIAAVAMMGELCAVLSDRGAAMMVLLWEQATEWHCHCVSFTLTFTHILATHIYQQIKLYTETQRQSTLCLNIYTAYRQISNYPMRIYIAEKSCLLQNAQCLQGEIINVVSEL